MKRIGTFFLLLSLAWLSAACDDLIMPKEEEAPADPAFAESVIGLWYVDFLQAVAVDLREDRTYVSSRYIQAGAIPSPTTYYSDSWKATEMNVGPFFREGDKVMQTQNNYQQEWVQTSGAVIEAGTGVFNGDIGVIQRIDPQTMQFTVRFDDDKVAVYQYSDIEQLALAYAVTIHKSQGCEFDAVVIALDANYMLQTRNLLYTAVTRAKKLVVVVGSKKTVARMIRNNETARRYSLLLNLIEEECRKEVF